MRWLKALAALVGLLIGLVGIPAGLVLIVGNPWPTEGIDLAAPLTDNAVIGLLAVAVWILWIQWAACVVAETITIARARHRDMRVPATFAGQRQLARMLIGTIAVAFMVAPTIASTAAASTAPEAGSPTGMASTMSLLAHSSTDSSAASQPQTWASQNTEQPETVTDRRPVVTVQRGDTLWALASHHLGDGMRWHDIAELNEGQTMVDGAPFRNKLPIMAGWKLAMPDDATNVSASADQPAEPDYTVQAGDTLSDIAEAELGDASAWPDIAEASANIDQPGGQHLSDPDHIEPGWKLRTTTDTTDSSESGSGGSDNTGSSETSQGHLDKPDQVGENTGAADTVAAPSDSDTAWPVRTSAGVGFVLASGIIGMLARKRRRQRRARPAGADVPVPTEQAQHAEIQLRSVAHLDHPDIVDVILRTLASHYAHTGQAMPTPQAARLTDETVELYLTGAASLPGPWTSVGDSATIWESPLQVPDESPYDGIPAPWPSLITLGHDDEAATVLANAEMLGAIGVVSDAATQQQILTAMAVELGTSPWASDLTVTLVGHWSDLTELLTDDRIRYVPTVGDATNVDGVEVLILAEVPDDTAAVRDNAVIVHPGPAEIGWTMRIDQTGTATVEPVGLRLEPQQLPAEQWRLISESLRTADITPGPPQPVANSPEQPIKPPEPPHNHNAAGSGAREAAHESEAATAVLDPEPPVLAAEPEPEPIVSDPAATGHPVIRLLAPTVRIDDADGTAPGQHMRVCTRIAAFLALNPDTARQQLIETIWPDRRVSANTVKTRVSQLRAWFGHHPTTGTHYLPAQQLHLNSDIRTDWDIFTDLTGPNPEAASTANLETALDLVEGRPFEGEEPQAYAFAEFAAQRMISDIVDAAYTLARRRYMDGYWRGAQEAAALGVHYEPGTERLWRIWIQAAHASHNPDAVDEAIDRMTARITEIGFNLEPETLDLITRVQSHKPIQEAQ